MKIYIKAAVSIENLKKQFGEGLSSEAFAEIVNIDPTADYATGTPSKYGVWIFNQNKRGNLKPENYKILHDALDRFSRDAAKFKFQDIGRYRTVAEFLEDAEQVANMALTDEEKARQLRKAAHRASDRDKRFIAADDNWELWEPLTYPGSISLARMGGAKAEWCTAYEGDEDYWDQYTGDGPLYIFINTDNPEDKYQLHFDSEQFCDFSDDNLGLDDFYEFISDKPNIKEFFESNSEYRYYLEHGRSDDDEDEDEYDEDEYNEDEDDYVPNPPQYHAPVRRRVAEPALPPVAATGNEDNIDDMLANISKNTTHLDLTGITATCLGRHTFSQFPELREVILPRGLEEIGRQAFVGCSALRKVVFPEGLKRIGTGAFGRCTSLKRVKLPDGLQTIGNEAFAYCDSLKDVHLPISLQEIGDNAFYNCTSLKSINLPEGLQTIHSGAFRGCTSLKNIEIPDGLQTMGTQVFLGCILLSQKSMDSLKKFCDRTGANLLGIVRQRMWG